MKIYKPFKENQNINIMSIKLNHTPMGILLIISLFIISCELFTGPKTDLFKQINDEVEWANAPKLTVRVEHPAAWGISNPTGNITPSKDIRKGYAFEIEFTPDLAYSLDSWRAYLTSSLPDNWMFDIGLLDGVERLDGASVIVPELPARGGTGSFIINTTENVTLVPWCRTEPYVLRTVPRHSPTMLYPRGTAIEIFFNAPLFLTANEELSFLFTDEIIKITAKDNDKEDEPVLISNNNYSYNYPVYTANNDLGEYKITITPTNVPGNSLIEVTAGPDICNASNTPMAKAEVFSFNTYPASGGGSIDTWSANYNENERTIVVTWNTTGAVSVEAHYRVNKSVDIAISDGSPVTIRGVSALNNSSVREGGDVTGIQEYEIFLDLIVEGLKSNLGSKSFKIWNIPGMSVAHNNQIIEINTEADFAAIRTPAADNPYYGLGETNKDKQYVLTNDITVKTWTPTGTSTDSFLGKFYGNGHTVTIKSMTAAYDTGLFGAVNDCLIRDLTVNYYNTDDNGIPVNAGIVNITRSAETRFGGIVGTMAGTTRMENVLIKGAVSITVDTDDEMFVGGIAGVMTDVAQMTNAYGGLDLTVIHPNSREDEKGSSVMVGGITGSIGVHQRYLGISWTTGLEAYAKIFNAIVEGNITVNASAAEAGAGGSVGLIVGGIVGIMRSRISSSPAGVFDSCYRRGNIYITSNTGIASLGGAVGFTDTYGKVQNCYSTAGNFTTIKTGGTYLSVGGFIGYVDFDFLLENCYSDNPINVTCSCEVYAGGFAGYIQSGTKYCYANGPVTVECLYGKVGGFSGRASKSIKYCYASGDVELKCNGSSTSEYIMAGGFSGECQNDLEDCYALGNVNVSGSPVSVGGLIGQFTGGSVNHSFSTGTVNVNGSVSESGGLFGGVSYAITLQNNAVLCKSVTKTSGDTDIGRFYGFIYNGTMGFSSTVKNNHAYSGMLVNGNTVSSGTHDNQNGANVTFEIFHFQDFWRNKVPASVPTTTSGLGFDPKYWIFTTVGNYGYPILRASESGPEMGGQR